MRRPVQRLRETPAPETPVFSQSRAVWPDESPEAVAILERDEQAVAEILTKGGPHADTIIHNRRTLGIPLPPFTKRNTR